LIEQRVTLPLAVFFRFHSAVVFIELFKEVFEEAGEEEETGQLEEGLGVEQKTDYEMDQQTNMKET